MKTSQKNIIIKYVLLFRIFVLHAVQMSNKIEKQNDVEGKHSFFRLWLLKIEQNAKAKVCVCVREREKSAANKFFSSTSFLYVNCKYLQQSASDEIGCAAAARNACANVSECVWEP